MKKKTLLSSCLLAATTLGLGGCSFLDGFLSSEEKDVVYSCNEKVDPLGKDVKTEETELGLEELYAYAVTGTVTVLAYSGEYSALSLGSGVIIEENKAEGYVYIITNAHVVADAKKSNGYIQTTVKAEIFEVIYHNNQRVMATLVAKNPTEDIAVLKADLDPTGTSNVITIADSDNVHPGQSVMAIGSPQSINYRNTATYGIVSNTKVKITADNDKDGNTIDFYMLQIDAALNPGNSGGPLFNMKGELIGINTMKLTSSSDGTVLESMNFSIPSNFASLIARQLINTGTYSRPSLGVQNIDLGDLSVKERTDAGIKVTTGLYVEAVQVGGVCHNKIFAGDVIVKINDVCVENREDFCTELYQHLPNDTVTFTVVDINGENQRTVTITL